MERFSFQFELAPELCRSFDFFICLIFCLIFSFAASLPLLLRVLVGHDQQVGHVAKCPLDPEAVHEVDKDVQD